MLGLIAIAEATAATAPAIHDVQAAPVWLTYPPNHGATNSSTATASCAHSTPGSPGIARSTTAAATSSSPRTIIKAVDAPPWRVHSVASTVYRPATPATQSSHRTHRFIACPLL